MNPIIEFHPHTKETWKAEWIPTIKVHVEWDKVSILKTYSYLRTTNKISIIYYPWPKNKKQCWMDSTENEKVEFGCSNLIIRAPALYFDDGFLLLDCCHRIKHLEPSGLIIDVIHVSEKSLQYFADMLSPCFRKKDQD